MRRRRVIAAIGALALPALVLGALAGWPALRGFLAVDACLDRGGAWDAGSARCVTSPAEWAALRAARDR